MVVVPGLRRGMVVGVVLRVSLSQQFNGFLSGGGKVRPLARVALVACAGGHEKPFHLGVIVESVPNRTLRSVKELGARIS
jgi:hypothetical protein